MNQRERIESDLYHIKILLIILIAVCITGFYGLSGAMDVMGVICKVLFWIFVFIVLVYLLVQGIDKMRTPKKNSELENNDGSSLQ